MIQEYQKCVLQEEKDKNIEEKALVTDLTNASKLDTVKQNTDQKATVPQLAPKTQVKKAKHSQKIRKHQKNNQFEKKLGGKSGN